MTAQRRKKLIWFVVRLAVSIGALVWVFWGIQWYDHAVVRLPGHEGTFELRVVERNPDGVTVVRTDAGFAGQRFTVADADIVRNETTGEALMKVGLRNVVRDIAWWPMAAALVIFGGVPFFAALRWRALLHVQQVRISVGVSMKLTWIGLFCNQFMPGMTGGDLVKAYYVTKHTDTSKAESAITILVDRIIGLLGLVLLSAVAMAIVLLVPSQASRVHDLPWAWLTPGVVVLLGGAAFYSQTIRRVMGINRLMHRLGEKHMLHRLDRAVYLYRHHKKVVAQAFGLTFLSHACLLTAVYLITRAVHLPVSPPYVVMFASLIFVASGLIPALAGLGPLEAGFVLCFAARGIGSQAVSLAVALVVRLQNVFWSLPGAAMMMLGSHLPSRAEMRHELEVGVEAEAPQPAAAAEVVAP
ncbi:MAG: hypothetical protein BIFFINMI_02902 [Phycisphaerae bacterium]|nr:hypothetical protein [Phycisphaerae bacterium]